MLLIINGPNLNILGSREPDIYGDSPFEGFLEKLRRDFPDTEIGFFQSNCEGAIIDEIQKAETDANCSGIIINPGAYSHYSIAIADALGAISKPAVEVHISNIHAREDYRRRSVTAERVRGVISGLGLDGYRLAIIHLINS